MKQPVLSDIAWTARRSRLVLVVVGSSMQAWTGATDYCQVYCTGKQYLYQHSVRIILSCLCLEMSGVVRGWLSWYRNIQGYIELFISFDRLGHFIRKTCLKSSKKSLWYFVDFISSPEIARSSYKNSCSSSTMTFHHETPRGEIYFSRCLVVNGPL